VLLIVFSALMSSGVILNSLYYKSQFLGIFFTLSFFASIGLVCGKALFDDEPLLLKAVKGFFVYIVLLTVLGTFLLLLNVFNMTFSMLLIVLVDTPFWIILARKTISSRFRQDEADKKFISVRKSQTVFSILVAAFCLAEFYTLRVSRTLTPMSDVWLTIPTWFFAVVGASSLLLSYFVLSKRNFWAPLVLIMLQGFLFVSIYYLVWYPSTYGDPLTDLGIARFVLDTGQIYARNFLLSQHSWLDLISGRAYSALVVQLTRMVNFDIYWIDNIAIPLLWAIIIPISLYEITCVLLKKPLGAYPKTAVLAAFSGIFLIPALISWGAAPTPNTLGFIFVFFSLSLLIRWLQTGKRLLLGLVVVVLVATGLAHPFPGIVGGVFLIIALIFHFVKNGFSRGVLLAATAFVYPILLGYPSRLTIQNMWNLQNFVAFEQTVLTIPLLIAALGFLFVYFRNKDVDRRIAFVLFVMGLVVVFDYYFSQYGIQSLSYGAGRILTIYNFLLAPFVASGIRSLVVSVNKVGQSSNMHIVAKRRRRIFSPKYLIVIVLSIIIALQSVVTLYQAYPLNEVGLAPTSYEADAIYYINSTADRPFSVVSDTLFTNLAIGLLGQGYSYGVFGVPDWSYYLQHVYLLMTQNPSLTLLKQVQDNFNDSEVYFVLSARLSNFGSVLEEMSALMQSSGPELTEKAFGDGNLYIFKYISIPVQGIGPSVMVTYDNGTIMQMPTRFRYVIKEEVTYNVTLTGSSSYNITNYPEYWTFQSLTINRIVPSTFDNSSDINHFIYKSGLLPQALLEVKWFADEFHTTIGWKEDSFKSGWETYSGQAPYPINPEVMSDGKVLTVSWNFTPGLNQVYYFAKAVNVSTDNYPYVIVRWKCSASVAVIGVYFRVGNEEFFQSVVPFGSESSDWTLTTVKLPSGMNLSHVMIGIADFKYLTSPIEAVLSVDYILIAG
jgi:hypothetical protein